MGVKPRRSSSRDWHWNLIGLSLGIACLYFGREVFVPFALSLLLAFLLKPLVLWLQRWGLSRVPAVLTSFTITFMLLAGMLFQVGNEFASLVNELPKYRSELAQKAKGIRGWEQSIERIFGNSVQQSDNTQDQSEEDTDQLRASTKGEVQAASATQVAGSDPMTPLYVVIAQTGSLSLRSWAESAGVLLGPLGTVGLVLVFTLFLMIYQDDLRDRLIKLFSGGQYVTTTRAINESAARISSYLMAQAVINFSYGAVISLGLWLISWLMGGDRSFPNILLWGFLCAILRFVPYIGPVFSSLFPLAIALAVFPGFKVFVAVLSLIVLVELISNNLLEPWLYGSSTGISAMAVIFASVFWGWIWGPVGLLLATPLTVCLVVLGKHFDAFSSFQTLLGDEEPLPTATRLYQRLLAGNTADALQLARQQTTESSRLHFLDTTLIPTIDHIRADREAGRLTRSDEKLLNDSLVEILSQVAHSEQTESGKQDSSSVVAAELNATLLTGDGMQGASESAPSMEERILLLPAHHFYEELVLGQVAGCLKSELQPKMRCQLAVDLLSTRTPASQLQQHLKHRPPTIVLIAIVPPGGLLQAEYLCELILSCAPGSHILTAWFGKPAKFDQLLIRLRKKGVSYVPTSIEQTLKFIESILETHRPMPQPLMPQVSESGGATEAPATVEALSRLTRVSGDSKLASP